MAEAAGGLRVASYNVHRCVGSDGVDDPERIIAVIRELDAAVVALQEVGVAPGAGPLPDRFDALARATGLVAVAGPTLESARAPYGNALLTRLPVRRVLRLDLSVPGREPRGALDVEIDAPGGPLHVVATHLGLSRRERRIQASRLLRHVRARPGPLVVLGDINAWPPVGAAVRRLEAEVGRTPRLATFPARRALLALDRVWVRPSDRLRALRVHRSALARVASDHLPLVAELEDA